jgi:hypothetical protein
MLLRPHIIVIFCWRRRLTLHQRGRVFPSLVCPALRAGQPAAAADGRPREHARVSVHRCSAAPFGEQEGAGVEVKVYDLELPLLLRLLPFIMLVLFTVGVPIVIVSTDAPTVLLVPLFGILGWNWWVLTTLAHRVVLHDDGVVEWVALARRVRMLPEDIIAIRPGTRAGIGFLTVKYAGGTVRLLNQITGFHEVLAHIKRRNPIVVIKGC